jgi:hypothetical protein
MRHAEHILHLATAQSDRCRPNAQKVAIFSHWSQLSIATTMAIGLLCLKHIQYLRTSAVTIHAEPTNATHGEPWRCSGGTSQPYPSPPPKQDEVKAGLDGDVELGVLEPVPVGESVTWCHHMVPSHVCAKKNRKPRRTVDFHALNLHATRETHHTQSPLHIKHITHKARDL